MYHHLFAGAEGVTEHTMVGWHQQPNGMSLSKLWEMVMDREAWHTEVHRVMRLPGPGPAGSLCYLGEFSFPPWYWLLLF